MRTDTQVATEEGPGSFLSEYVSAPQFAGDQAVYSARVGPEWFIVANDRSWPLGDLMPETDLIVSTSGKYVAFGARRRRELWWRAIDVRTTAEQAANETHWVMLGRGRSANGLTLDSNGRLMVGDRTVGGFQAAADVPNVIVSPSSSDRQFAFVVATGSPSLWIVDMTAVRAEGLRLPGRGFTAISHLAWSRGKCAAILESVFQFFHFDCESRQVTPLDLALPRNISVRRVPDAPEWDGERATVVVNAFCERDDGLDACGRDVSGRWRRYAVALSTTDGSTRTRRVDLATPAGAEETLSAFFGNINRGEIEEAVKLVRDDAMKTDRNAIKGMKMALKAFEPLIRVIGPKMSFSTLALTASPTYAVAKVRRTAPDYTSAPATRQFNEDYFGWMFMSGLQAMAGASQTDQESQFRSLVPIVRRYAEALQNTTPPSVVTTVQCTLAYEGGRWFVDPGCGNFAPTR